MKKTVGRISALLLAAITAIAGLTVIASPASAAFSDCSLAANPAERACMWTLTNGTGTRTELFVSSHGTACWNFAGSVNNNAESVKTVTHRAVRFFNGTNCTGLEYTLWPNSLGTAANLPASSINQISSFRFGPDPNTSDLVNTKLASASALRSMPSNCTSGWSSWKTAGSPVWGQWRECHAEWQDEFGTWKKGWKFQVDDTLTDGYGVHLERTTYGTWGDIPGTDPSEGNWLQSTGSGETSYWPELVLVNLATESVRLVKGVVWPSHQNVGTSGSWILQG